MSPFRCRRFDHRPTATGDLFISYSLVVNWEKVALGANGVWSKATSQNGDRSKISI